MKERSKIFRSHDIRAILEGRKTMFREVVKPQPPKAFPFPIDDMKEFWWTDRASDCDDLSWWPNYDDGLRSRYAPGDRLWVRETWGLHAYHDMTDWCLRGDDITMERWQIQYRADWGESQEGCFWRPSIHMPKWASRITLEITSVRVERLQEISEEDAWVEGYKPETFYRELDKLSLARKLNRLTGVERMPAQSWFIDLWESINGPGSWDANPWVWVIEFMRIKP